MPFLFLMIALTVLSMTTPQAQATTTAQPPQAPSAETTRINIWFEIKFKEQLSFSPIQQTFLGQKSPELDDMSIAAQDKVLAWRRAATAEMRTSFDYARLTPEAQTSYDVWIYQLEQAEAAVRFRTNAYVFDQMSASIAVARASVRAPLFCSAAIFALASAHTALSLPVGVNGAPVMIFVDSSMTKSYAKRGGRTPVVALFFEIPVSWRSARPDSRMRLM